MTDALEGIHAEEIKKQLLLLRVNAGTVIESERLRQILKGFRGQKGIYKPSGSPHALWVRETLRGPYPDQKPEVFPDGSWTYRYTPEGRGGRTDMTLDTNKSLLKCKDDRIPVGVLRQRVAEQGAASYEILGLAYVTDFDGTHFILQGEPIKWEDLPVAGKQIPPFRPFDEKPLPRRELMRLQRDSRFGFIVRQAYNEKCSLCDVGYRLHGRLVGVEAAHIIPVEDRGNTADVRNGMLLCRNHHTLFDEYAWTPDEDFRVMVTDEEDFRRSAAANCVLDWEGKRLQNLPLKEYLLPATEALRYRLSRFEEA